MVDSYVSVLCASGTRKQGGKLLIEHVTDVPLKTILFMVTRLEGSTSTHLASKTQVLISLRATDGVVFDWYSGLLANLKDQLTRCHLGRQKQFGYGSILACFFFQRVLAMRPWAVFPSFTVRDLVMLKWSGLLMQLGGERQPHFSEDFLSRLDQDMLMVDDYGYVGIDFRNDLNLVLPECEDWDVALGKKHVFSFHVVILYMFCDFIMFLVYGITNIMFCRLCTDTTNRNVPDIIVGENIRLLTPTI